MHKVEVDEELSALMEEEYKDAKGVALNGKIYTTVHAWKFDLLLREWKEDNPMKYQWFDNVRENAFVQKFKR